MAAEAQRARPGKPAAASPRGGRRRRGSTKTSQRRRRRRRRGRGSGSEGEPSPRRHREPRAATVAPSVRTSGTFPGRRRRCNCPATRLSNSGRSGIKRNLASCPRSRPTPAPEAVQEDRVRQVQVPERLQAPLAHRPYQKRKRQLRQAGYVRPRIIIRSRRACRPRTPETRRSPCPRKKRIQGPVAATASLKWAKGFRGKRKNCHAIANEAVQHAWMHMYRSRKRPQARLPRAVDRRINAAARNLGISYSKLIGGWARPATCSSTARCSPRSRSAIRSRLRDRHASPRPSPGVHR